MPYVFGDGEGARDDRGKRYSVRYEAVNAMLLNEFLKEHREVEEQQTTIGRLNDGGEARSDHREVRIRNAGSHRHG